MRTLNEREQMSQEERARKDREEAKMRALFVPYGGKTKGLKVIEPNRMLLDAAWNEHHLFPVRSDDPVYMHPEQPEDKKYVRVIYYNGTFVATLDRIYFGL